MYRFAGGYRKISLRYRPSFSEINALKACEEYLGMAQLELYVNTKKYDM